MKSTGRMCGGLNATKTGISQFSAFVKYEHRAIRKMPNGPWNIVAMKADRIARTVSTYLHELRNVGDSYRGGVYGWVTICVDVNEKAMIHNDMSCVRMIKDSAPPSDSDDS